jgi:hypothetical protein
MCSKNKKYQPDSPSLVNLSGISIINGLQGKQA